MIYPRACRRLDKIGGRALLLLPLLAVSQALASTYSDLVLSYSPAAYWRLGESAGTTAADVTGTHNGTYQNSVSPSAAGAIVGDANTAADFNAVTEYR